MSAPDASTRTGRTVVGLFDARESVEAAIRDLKDAGFTNEQIGVALRDQREQRDLVERSDVAPPTDGAAAGAATGAVTGGVIGGLIGLLGSLLIPGLGPIVAGGVLASMLVGAGAGAATGGIIGALIGMGVSEEEARYYETGFKEGRILVTVDAGARAEEAVRILQRHRADLGPSRMPDVAPGFTGPTTTAGAFTPASMYGGPERRRWRDPAYSGVERRGTESGRRRGS